MKIYIHMPEEYFGRNLTPVLNHTIEQLKQEYRRDHFVSNYTGDGTIESSDMVVVLKEFSELPSSKKTIEYCKKHKKKFHVSRIFFQPERFYFPFEP